MENENKSRSSSKGTDVPIAQPQKENPEIKEGDSAQQRPAYGSEAGTNTSSREDQLPSLNNGGVNDGDDLAE